MKSLPNKQSPSIFGVKQKLSKDSIGSDEYVLCDLEKGAWRCPGVSDKTLISSHIYDDEPKLSAANLGSNEKKGSKLRIFKAQLSDVVGEELGKVHFAFDESYLTDYSKSLLDQMISKVNGKPVLLLGYTDNIGVEKYNDTLALARANEVKFYLEERGVMSELLHSEGNGVCCYLEPNGSEEQRQINRRVELYFAD